MIRSTCGLHNNEEYLKSWSLVLFIELWKYGVTYPNLDMFYQIHLVVNVDAHDKGIACKFVYDTTACMKLELSHGS